MKTKGNTILITGGATGIGFALAEALLKAGNEVIICGRRIDKLQEAKGVWPQLHIKVCDVSVEKERKELFQWTKENFKDINMLINNAGVQKMADIRKISEVIKGENEIATNFVAPIHLSSYFIPLLLKKKEAAIINVTSGLGFVPIAAMPIYCATKAALHSFTVSLRYQLRDTLIKVFEIIPPMVDTELGRGSIEEENHGYKGIKPSVLAKEVLPLLARDQYEIAVGDAKGLVTGSRTDPEQTFMNINRW